MVLNSSDKLFAELRDMDFPTAAARVNRDLKRLKDGYDRSKASAWAHTVCRQLIMASVLPAWISAYQGSLNIKASAP
jgi:hypothetical protein